MLIQNVSINLQPYIVSKLRTFDYNPNILLSHLQLTICHRLHQQRPHAMKYENIPVLAIKKHSHTV